MKKKNLFGLLLLFVMSLFSSQAMAATVTLDWRLDGETYDAGIAKYAINDALFNILFQGKTTETITNGEECFFQIYQDVTFANGKTVDDVKVTWNGGEPIQYLDNGYGAEFYFTVDGDGTLVVEWASEGGETPVEYCKTDENYNRTSSGSWDPARYIRSLSVTGGTNEFTMSENYNNTTSRAIYQDLTTTDVIEAEQGATLTFTSNWQGNAMHGIIYIDYDGDGTFEAELNTDGTPTATSEAVSFTNYGNIDSKGNAPSNSGFMNDSRVMPSFTIPTNLETGDYRLRFLIVWSSSNSGVDELSGLACGREGIGADGGDMIDFTLKVVERVVLPPVAVTTTFNEATVEATYAANGTTVDWSAVEAGLAIDLKVTAPAGKVIRSVNLNGTPVVTETGNVTSSTCQITVTEASTLEVVLGDPEYIAPAGTNIAERYLTGITSTDAKENIAWTGAPLTTGTDQSTNVYTLLTEGITVEQGSTFSINFAGNDSNSDNCLHYTIAQIFADWNGDKIFSGSFPANAKTENLVTAGEGEWLAIVGGEESNNRDLHSYTHQFTVPEDAPLGEARIRITYTDAWGVPYGPDVQTLNKGMAYDIPVTIVEATTQVTSYTVNVATPENGTLVVMNGENAIESGASIEEGTTLTIVAEAADGYVLESVTVNGEAYNESTITVEEEVNIAATFRAFTYADFTAPTFTGAGNPGKLTHFSTTGGVNNIDFTSNDTSSNTFDEADNAFSGAVTAERSITAVAGAKVEFNVQVISGWGRFFLFAGTNNNNIQKLLETGCPYNAHNGDIFNNKPLYVEDTYSSTSKVENGTLPSITIPEGTAIGTEYLVRFIIGSSTDDGVYNGTYKEGYYYDFKITVVEPTEPPVTKDYIYRAEDLTFNGEAKEANLHKVPATEATQILTAENLTIAVDFTIESAVQSSVLGFTSAVNYNAFSEFTTLGITTWSPGSDDALLVRYNESGGQYSQGKLNLAGTHKAVFVLTADGFEYYLDGASVRKTVPGEDMRFVTKTPNADEVQIGGLSNFQDDKYPFNGTIHSITYYNKGEMDLTEDQFNALFPAEEEQTKEYAVTVNAPEGVTYELFYINEADEEVEFTSGNAIPENSEAYILITAVPEGKEIDAVTWNETATTPVDGVQEVVAAYSFTVTAEGTVVVTLKDAPVVSDTYKITVNNPENYTLRFEDYDYNSLNPEAIGKDVLDVYVTFTAEVPETKVLKVTWNDADATLNFQEGDQYTYMFRVESDGTLSITLEDKPVETYTVTVVNNDITYYVADANMNQISDLSGIAAGTELTLLVNTTVPEGQVLKVTWGEQELEGKDEEFFISYKFTVDGNKTLTIELVAAPAPEITIDVVDSFLPISAVAGQATTATVNVKGANLTDDIIVSYTTEGGSFADGEFTLSTTTISKDEAMSENGYNLVLTVNAAEEKEVIVTLNLQSGDERVPFYAYCIVEEAPVVENKALLIPATDGTNHYQFRFDDIVLGDHVNGTNNTWVDGAATGSDNRARNFTMSAWVKPTALQGQIMGHGQANMYNAGGTFGVCINGDKLQLKSRSWSPSSTDGGNCPGNTDVTSDVTVVAGKWMFVTVVVDDTNKSIKLYKNGALAAEQALNATYGIGLLQDPCVFFVGNGDFSGYVDEVQVWTKALNEEEIAASMDGYTSAPEGLAAYYVIPENATPAFNNAGTYNATDEKATLVKGTEVNYGWWVEYSCSDETTATYGDAHSGYFMNIVVEGGNGTVAIEETEGVAYENGDLIPTGVYFNILFTPEVGYKVESVIDQNGSDWTFLVQNNALNWSMSAHTTLTVTFIVDESAIEGINADAKAIYYANGKLYNYAGEIAIFDVNGKLIDRTSEQVVDVTGLANGVYIVRSAEKTVRFVK